MPQLISMRALVAFDHNGKHLKVGDEFGAYPIEAASLNFKKKAAFTTAAQRRQALATREMTAAPRSEPAQAERVAEPADGRRTTHAGRGAYRRRDMAAPEDKG